MRGREFIAIALQLRTTTTEAASRTRISRVYYAAFLEAREFVQSHLGIAPIRSSATHRAVADALASLDPQLQVDLGLLRELRNGADYDMNLPAGTLSRQADQASALAASIIFRLDRYDGAVAAAEVALGRPALPRPDTQAVRGYLPDVVAGLLPVDPNENDAIGLVLLSYPHLPGTIAATLEIIDQVYPGSTVTMDTQQYDEWEPPIRLVIHHRETSDQDFDLFRKLMERLRTEIWFDDNLIQVFPKVAPSESGQT